MQKVQIGKAAIDNLSWPEALKKIEEMVESPQPGFIVTPNADHIVELETNITFQNAYQKAGLVLADGMPLLWGAKYLGTPLKAKISGSDLAPVLCKLSGAHNTSLFFLGAAPGIAEKAAEKMKNEHPDIQFAGCYSPAMGFENDPDENEKIIDMINASGAGLVFVAFGAPKQELWMANHFHKLDRAILIGVGATLDFMAGNVKRAPKIMQNTGTEWLYRLGKEPRRLFLRYLRDFSIFKIIWNQKNPSQGA